MFGVEQSDRGRGAEPQRREPAAEACTRDARSRPAAMRPAPIAAGLFGLVLGR